MSQIIPIERIENKILLIRRQKVLLDADLAFLYDVSVGRLNEAVKRKCKIFFNFKYVVIADPTGSCGTSRSTASYGFQEFTSFVHAV